jgi:cellobiose-specific phosphotransferase system component IIA
MQKSAHEQHAELIRRWQQGEKTPELASEYLKVSEAVIFAPYWVSYDAETTATMKEIHQTLEGIRFNNLRFAGLSDSQLRSAITNISDSDCELKNEMLKECGRRASAGTEPDSEWADFVGSTPGEKIVN